MQLTVTDEGYGIWWSTNVQERWLHGCNPHDVGHLAWMAERGKTASVAPEVPVVSSTASFVGGRSSGVLLYGLPVVFSHKSEY